mmetsp:Transcript_30542/g.55386  ORF Transcript_30542/g.55386 Transcript_30542/m.55386 type:complete len:398 (+) Transcript_30542:72-1265(+)|eukprot:CAMPEP_0201920188 /NCGR_PEP_ID=MMETSP0903-20130614/8864_1 /ASSEMBLY_ACC=CAM_ASM_000552 /TAXON_ID=420261 /ORGANISM="Thalassiosira antarctica, Strain CCMP982" /LENGTH=397 /DNA_ID=CAMNT_0048456875 /DNA_START=15 /DNA_END=1208 /DNA_ORIENTATION=-
MGTRMGIPSVIFLWCFVALQSAPNTDAFAFNKPVTFSQGRKVISISHHLTEASNAKYGASSSSPMQRKMASISSDDDGAAAPTKDKVHSTLISNMYTFTGILSALAWIITAYVALSFHPDPKFADCTLRHNVLTMSQAFAFPLPVAWASFEALRKGTKNNHTLKGRTSRRLNLAVAAASFWLAASSAFPPAFAFGYDLYSFQHKVAASIIHAVTGTFALVLALRSTSVGHILRGLMNSLWNFGPTSGQRNSSLYATGAAGLLYFTIQPIVSPYPLATIPTILGKRLSRPASAFTLLGAVIAYCLKEERNTDDDDDSIIRTTLRRGLAWGTAAHLCLIFMKIIGVDGGGLIFRGRGLWEVYPAMVNVPFAAGVSFAVHAVLCFGALTKEEDEDAAENE